MRQRIICPFHEEVTASCIIYDDHYHCYGCGAGGPLSDLKGTKIEDIKPRPKEDLSAAFKYIKTLNSRVVRGLLLPCDSDFLYIIWPNNDYYTKRTLAPHTTYRQKYLCPGGHTRPLYVPQNKGQRLFIVEGELNALSLAQVSDDWAVCSPGGTGDFTEKHLTFYQNYSKIILVVDKDAAGAIAVIRLKSLLSRYCADVRHYLLEEDFNAILVRNGKEGLREFIKERMAV